MYGYITPDTDKVGPRDFAMFRAAYCGLCVSLKENYGQLSRYSTSYDMAFFTLVSLEATAPKLEFDNIRCIGQPALKTIIKPGPFMTKMSAISIILFYYKLLDDVIDGSGKKALVNLVKKRYEKAKALCPKVDEIVSNGYEKLRNTEVNKVASIDMAADAFASILAGLIASVMESETNEAYKDMFTQLCYNLGKFVYICDAIDDIDEDYASGSYNPVLLSYPDFSKGKRKEYLEKYNEPLSFALKSCIYRTIECFNRIKCTEVHGILENVIYYGLEKKAEELLSSSQKLKAPRVSIPRRRLKRYRAEWKNLSGRPKEPASNNNNDGTNVAGDGDK